MKRTLRTETPTERKKRVVSAAEAEAGVRQSESREGGEGLGRVDS